MGLNLFPVRVPIGKTIDSTGKALEVLMTQEFARALSDLFERVGGEFGMSNADIEALAYESFIPRPAITEDDQPADPAPGLALVMAELEQMRERVQALEQQTPTAPACCCDDAEQLLFGMAGAAVGVDWERPGKIGFKVPNTAAFTTITASGAVALSPANASVVLSPTGTGVVTIAPATAGAMDNVSIGSVTPQAATFTTLLASGKFGCNGKPVQGSYAVGAPLSAYAAGASGLLLPGDMAALVAKVTALETALINNGIAV